MSIKIMTWPNFINFINLNHLKLATASENPDVLALTFKRILRWNIWNFHFLLFVRIDMTWCQSLYPHQLCYTKTAYHIRQSPTINESNSQHMSDLIKKASFWRVAFIFIYDNIGWSQKTNESNVTPIWWKTHLSRVAFIFIW